MHNTKNNTSQSIQRFKQVFGEDPTDSQTDQALLQHIDDIVDRQNKKLIKSFKKATTNEAAKLSK